MVDNHTPVHGPINIQATQAGLRRLSFKTEKVYEVGKEGGYWGGSWRSLGKCQDKCYQNALCEILNNKNIYF